MTDYPGDYRKRWAKRFLLLKLLILLVVNLIAVVVCAIYATSARGQWNIVHAHEDQLSYPHLNLHDLRKGYIAAVGRIIWAFILVVAGIFAPIWFYFVLVVAGLAWDIQLDDIAYGSLYPSSGGQCKDGNLSDSLQSFFATLGGIEGVDPVEMCADYASAGGALQVYVTVGIISSFVAVILMEFIGSCSESRRERGESSVSESAFSFWSSMA